MVDHRVVSPYELLYGLAESHTVTPRTEGPIPVPATSRDTYCCPSTGLGQVLLTGATTHDLEMMRPDP